MTTIKDNVNILFSLAKLLFISQLCFAHNIEISIQKGDTFNTILRAHSVSEKSIDLINASLDKNPVLSRLNPGDKIKLQLSKNNGLITAYINQNSDHFVLNKTAQAFNSSAMTHDDDVKIISLSYEEEPESKLGLIAQRAVKTLFPEFKSGTIYAAIKDDQLVSVKTASETETHYAFLQETEGFPVYTDANGKVLSPAIARTPTDHFWISSRFNPQRLHPITKKVRPHNGVDLAGPINTPIWAAANGTIIHKSDDTTFGNMIIIKHASGIETIYAHLNKYHDDLHIGKKVQAFETIGYVGSTGVSTGYHLHFEIHINGTAYDPLTVDFPNTQNITSLALPYYF